jgi:hypothetical protein
VKRAVSGRDHSLSGLGDLSDGSWIPDVLVFDFLEADMKWQYPAALLGILWQLSQEVFLEITV